MPFAFIAATHKRSAGDCTTDAIDTTGANLIVVGAGVANADNQVSDSKGNSWTIIGNVGGFFRMWYCVPSSVGSGHTFSVGGSGDSVGISVAAYSGVNTGDPIDSPATFANGPASTWQPGSLTPDEDNELFVTCILQGNLSAGLQTIDSGFTLRTSGGWTTWDGNIADLIQTTAAAKNPTWDDGGATSIRAGGMATFKAAAASGFVPFPRPRGEFGGMHILGGGVNR